MMHASNRTDPRAPGASEPPPLVQPSDEAIRKRAYLLYQLRGESLGDPLADWLAAEHELRSGRPRSSNAGLSENGDVE